MTDAPSLDVDLHDPAVQEDWYPTYDRLRSECPVHKMPVTGERVLTRYDDISYALRHPEIFPNSRTNTSFRLFQSDQAMAIFDERGWPRSTPLGSNPPIHRAYRALIDPWLAGPQVERYRPMITGFVDELLDALPVGEPFDFLEEVAKPLPYKVITSVMGFPQKDRDRLSEWAAAWVKPFMRGLSEEQEVEVASQLVDFQHYLVDAAHARRRQPSDDLTSHVANALLEEEGKDPRPLTDEELAGVLDHVFVGGNETTTFALTSGLWLLCENPEAEAALRADIGLLDQFLREVLRLESPTQGLWKGVSEDVELSGVTIPAGSGVHVRFAAANRDPERFGCPAQLDLERSNSGRHLAFGAGVHRCPGEFLTLLEQRITYERLFERFERIELAPGLNTFEHIPGFTLRSLRELHLIVR